MTAESNAERAALVTGAARGLAQGIVVDLAARGFRVAFTFRPNGTPPDETLAVSRCNGANVVAVPCDHALERATLAAVREAEGAIGEIDTLVHTVGPMVARRFERLTLDDYREMLDTNLRSAVEAAKALLPGMRERGFGRLVYFGMHGSHATLPMRGLTFYGAAKAAVTTFARTLALEEKGRGITVNVVEPGDIRDKSLESAAAREVVEAVRLLVSRETGFLNGAVLGVGGGVAVVSE
jgi:3-oxoacyl-[acyl-carrier protein] reductase